jgi:hypothetical protein
MPPEIMGGFFNLNAPTKYDGPKADIYSAGGSVLRGKDGG